MRKRFLFFAVAAFCGAAVSLLLPDAAYAWGPGAHMVTGNWLLQNLAVLPPLVAEPLMARPGLFLHGCLSADIFIGKGSVAKKGHSHNWESGFDLLGGARSLGKRAYAFGYLAHLAADTVAHNVFVPQLFPIAPGNGRLAHVYLEMQADRLLDWDTRDALAVFNERGSKGALAMLRRTFRKNPFKFELQTRAYRGGIALGGSGIWRRSLSVVDGIFPEHVRAARLGDLLAVSARAAADVLRLGEQSRVLALDPIGSAALAKAVAARAAQGFFPGRRAEGASFFALPETLQSLPAVCVK